jgi:hypothetical protein
MMGGRGELGAMVATPLPAVPISKLMVSAPRLAFVSWRAALKVQNDPKLTTLQVPSPGLASALSSERLTVNVLDAA